MTLVLASTSRYRRDLLARLGLPFDVARPEVDETPSPDERPADVAARLAVAKAADVAARNPGAWVIGSDQVADHAGRVLGKPGDRAHAIAQLTAMSGRSVVFHTAVAVLREGFPPCSAMDATTVHFRVLSRGEIERYVDAEQPFDCAGSFKCEGLGIVLFTSIATRDPTALIGLPLIETARLLRDTGFRLP